VSLSRGDGYFLEGGKVTSGGQLSARPHFVRGFIDRKNISAQNQGRIVVEITVLAYREYRGIDPLGSKVV
jgi:hypothetical protein